jgi:hypothetical protein
MQVDLVGKNIKMIMKESTVFLKELKALEVVMV